MISFALCSASQYLHDYTLQAVCTKFGGIQAGTLLCGWYCLKGLLQAFQMWPLPKYEDASWQSAGSREFLASAELWCPAKLAAGSVRKLPRKATEKRDSIGTVLSGDERKLRGPAQLVFNDPSFADTSAEKPSWFRSHRWLDTNTEEVVYLKFPSSGAINTWSLFFVPMPWLRSTGETTLRSTVACIACGGSPLYDPDYGSGSGPGPARVRRGGRRGAPHAGRRALVKSFEFPYHDSSTGTRSQHASLCSSASSRSPRYAELMPHAAPLYLRTPQLSELVSPGAVMDYFGGPSGGAGFAACRRPRRRRLREAETRMLQYGAHLSSSLATANRSDSLSSSTTPCSQKPLCTTNTQPLAANLTNKCIKPYVRAESVHAVRAHSQCRRFQEPQWATVSLGAAVDLLLQVHVSHAHKKFILTMLNQVGWICYADGRQWHKYIGKQESYTAMQSNGPLPQVDARAPCFLRRKRRLPANVPHSDILPCFSRGKKAKVSPPRVAHQVADRQPESNLNASQRTGASNNLVEMACSAVGAPNQTMPVQGPIPYWPTSSEASTGLGVFAGRLLPPPLESADSGTSDAQSSGKSEADSANLSPSATQLPAKKHISFNAIVEQCIVIDGGSGSMNASTSGGRGYVEDDEDGLYEDVGMQDGNSDSDEQHIDKEDEEEDVLEIKSASRRGSSSSLQNARPSFESDRQTPPHLPSQPSHQHRHSSTGSYPERPQFRHSSGRHSSPHMSGSGSGSGSNSGSTSQGSHSRSAHGSRNDCEHVTIAPIAPTILKGGGVDKDEAVHERLAIQRLREWTQQWQLRLRKCVRQRLWRQLLVRHGGYGYGEDVIVGRGDAFENFKRAEGGQWQCHSVATFVIRRPGALCARPSCEYPSPEEGAEEVEFEYFDRAENEAEAEQNEDVQMEDVREEQGFELRPNDVRHRRSEDEGMRLVEWQHG
ncbi:hypothetical protein DFH11DRAFT_1549931 [Phellopilus nigrolimitatus]|nr:hypothetical protein DFH11DRAFT_1549931 [Phellopilus nigrolimitatus]